MYSTVRDYVCLTGKYLLPWGALKCMDATFCTSGASFLISAFAPWIRASREEKQARARGWYYWQRPKDDNVCTSEDGRINVERTSVLYTVYQSATVGSSQLKIGGGIGRILGVRR